MILTCPECSAKYVVDPKALMPAGRMVRCAKCRHTWREMPPSADIPVVSEEEERRNLAPEPPEDQPEDQSGGNRNTEATAPTSNSPSPEPGTNSATTAEPNREATTKDQELPFMQRAKRPRPIPRGSNLPALQNHQHGHNMWGWISLVAFVVLSIGSILLFHETISETWPPARKMYQIIGMQDSPAGAGHAATATAAPKVPISKRLVIENLEPAQEYQGNVPILIVRGEVRNITDEPQKIPPLKVALQDAQRTTIRQWIFHPSPGMVAAGKHIRFETRLPDPPQDARDLRIAFTEEK
tara:strand:- start:1469 stop:2359 length:891 start_codon:yes stop_codon:yes gene_type:complete